MIIQPWSPDPDKYADECRKCAGAGAIALNGPDGVEDMLCDVCAGTGMVVDWTVVEPALLGERQ